MPSTQALTTPIPLNPNEVLRAFLPIYYIERNIHKVQLTIFGILSAALLCFSMALGYSYVSALVTGRHSEGPVLLAVAVFVAAIAAGTFAFSLSYFRAVSTRNQLMPIDRQRYGLWITNQRLILKDIPVFKDWVKQMPINDIIKFEVRYYNMAPIVRIYGKKHFLALFPLRFHPYVNGDLLHQAIVKHLTREIPLVR